MGRFDPTYSDDQRWAISAGAVDSGLTGKRVQELAADGELAGPDGEPLDPFKAALSTIYDYMREEREKRQGEDRRAKAKGTPEERLDAFTERSLNIIEHQQHLLEKLGAKRLLTQDEDERLRKLHQVARELRALVRGQSPIKGGGRQAAERAEKTEPPPDNALTSQLVRELQGAAKLDPQGGEHPEHHNGNTETSPVPVRASAAVG